jgi:adenylate kinase family enzyme
MDEMQRIIILGPCGAGKSTFARQLTEVLGIPLVHLDKLYWKPGWVESENEDFLNRLKQILEQPTWIVDGNYTGKMSSRFEAADTIIYMDYPKWIYFPRILKRIITSYGRVRPDMAEGCPEQFDWEFIVYCWRFRRDTTPKIVRQIAKCGQQIESVQGRKKILEFKRPKQLRLWLDQLAQ